MPPQGRGQKHPSTKTLVEEIREDVVRSMNAKEAVLGAFCQLLATEMTAEALRSLPPKIARVHLTAKYEPNMVSFVTTSFLQLVVLPPSLCSLC